MIRHINQINSESWELLPWKKFQVDLFVFCVAIVAFNILSTVKAALKSVHGVGKVEAGLSDYYLVEEVASSSYIQRHRGMAIAKRCP